MEINSTLNGLIQNRKVRTIAFVLGSLLVVLLGGLIFNRCGDSPEKADKRLEEREAKIRQLEDSNNQLRGENKQLRDSNAKLEAKQVAIEQMVDERGGAIEQKVQELSKIDERLKSNEAAINATSDPCVQCCSYSAELLRTKLIAKALDCGRQCAGAGCPR